MAQTGYTPILIYSSSTASNTPLAANLTNSALGSELAINITDGKLFYKDNGGSVQVIGWKVRPATAGGTGLTSFAVGDLIYADTTTTLAKLPDVATGNALISGGVNTAPSWGKIGLTTHVSGTLPIANGGTNQTSFTSPISSVAGLVWFDGTSLKNSATTSNVGYNATTNIFYVNKQISAGDVYVGATSASLLGERLNVTGNGIAIQDASTYSVLGLLGSFGGANFVMGSYSATPVQIRSGNATSLTIGTSTDVTVNTGNLVQGTAAKGINFTANTPASGMTSQNLTWYEEGTWTPTWSGGTMTSALIRYTRIGRQVTCTFELTYGTSLSGAPAYLTLPFTGIDTYSSGGVNYTDVGTTLFVNVETGNGRFGFRSTSNGAGLTSLQLAGKSVYGFLTYFV